MPKDTTQFPQNSYYHLSCLACRKGHRKCNRVLPSCDQCSKRKIDCCYAPRKKRNDSPSSSSSPYHLNDGGHSSQSSDDDISIENSLVPVASTNGTYSNASSFLALLNRPRSPVLKSIPRSVPLPQTGDMFDFRVKMAMGLAMQAFALLHVPDQDSKMLTAQQFLSKMRMEMQRTFPIAADQVSEIDELSKSFSRMELIQSADDLFLKAKEIILDPDIYPHIADNAQLAHTCSTISHYIMNQVGNGRHLSESKLFMRPVKVFLDCKGGLVHFDTFVLTGFQKEAMDLAKDQVTNVLMDYYMGKMFVVFHEKPSKKGLTKFVNTMLNLNKHTKETKVYFSQPLLEQLRHVIQEQTGLERYTNMCQLIDTLVSSAHVANNCSFDDDDATATTHAFVLLAVLRYYVLKLELATHVHRLETISQFKQFRSEVAIEIMSMLASNPDLFAIFGSFIFPIVMEISEIIAQYAQDAMFYKDTSVDLLLHVLACIRSTTDYIERLYAKYKLNNCLAKVSDLRKVASMLVNRIELLQRQSTVEAEYTTPEFNIDSFLDPQLLSGIDEISPLSTSIFDDFLKD